MAIKKALKKTATSDMTDSDTKGTAFPKKAGKNAAIKKRKKSALGCCGSKKKPGSKKGSANKKTVGKKKPASVHRPKALSGHQRQPLKYVGPVPPTKQASKTPVPKPAAKNGSTEPRLCAKSSDESSNKSLTLKTAKMAKETEFERESKVIKQKKPEKMNGELATSHTKTADRTPKESAVILEELSIRTFERENRLHRTFQYHISRPLYSKPVSEPSKKDPCIVLQQSRTSARFSGVNGSIKPLCVSTTSIKPCDMESGNGKEVPLSSNAEEVIRQLYTGVQYLIESQKKDSSN